MAFADQVAAMDALLLRAFSTSTNALTVHYSSPGAADLSLPAVVKNPAMEEDYVPGSLTGVTVLLLFIRPSLTDIVPQRGDTATYGGVEYDIHQIDADREGGYTLRLRRRANSRST